MMLPNSAIYEAVFEKYPSWEECERSAFSQTHARKLNMARRHLNQEQRRGLIQAELKDRPQVSDRQIAKGLGVDHKTVSVQRATLESIGEIPQCDRQTKDGRTYPAERQVERKAPQPELPSIPQRPISINVAKPEQVKKTATQAMLLLKKRSLKLSLDWRRTTLI